jgi:hypothetical protein
MTIAGINFFTDYETKSSQKRLSLGLEYQRANFSANINKYHVFSDKKLVGIQLHQIYSNFHKQHYLCLTRQLLLR